MTSFLPMHQKATSLPALPAGWVRGASQDIKQKIPKVLEAITKEKDAPIDTPEKNMENKETEDENRFEEPARNASPARSAASAAGWRSDSGRENKQEALF
jgi:hypothetical protein